MKTHAGVMAGIAADAERVAKHFVEHMKSGQYRSAIRAAGLMTQYATEAKCQQDDFEAGGLEQDA